MHAMHALYHLAMASVLGISSNSSSRPLVWGNLNWKEQPAALALEIVEYSPRLAMIPVSCDNNKVAFLFNLSWCGGRRAWSIKQISVFVDRFDRQSADETCNARRCLLLMCHGSLGSTRIQLPKSDVKLKREWNVWSYLITPGASIFQ